jgi:hypothetical protein
MKLLEVPVTIREKIQYLLQPVMAGSQSLGEPRTEEDLRGWQAINDRLKVLEQHPAEFDEEGLEPPSADVFPLVDEVALVLENRGVSPPLRVVPNGEGGVVFEWRDHPFFWSLDVEKEGGLALSIFRNARLVSRHQLS